MGLQEYLIIKYSFKLYFWHKISSLICIFSCKVYRRDILKFYQVHNNSWFSEGWTVLTETIVLSTYLVSKTLVIFFVNFSLRSMVHYTSKVLDPTSDYFPVGWQFVEYLTYFREGTLGLDNFWDDILIFMQMHFHKIFNWNFVKLIGIRFMKLLIL